MKGGETEPAAQRPPGTSVPVVDGRSGAFCYRDLAPQGPGAVKVGTTSFPLPLMKKMATPATFLVTERS